ncbi:MAG: iron-containing alcohol dehydrogenase [Candidatus Aminicenantes bacterium]|nr:iron-containing alcohol dehydrogenase [Candidatus Aminicenantes bacterium]
MKEFVFFNPTRVVFGEGKTTLIGELTRPYGRRVLLVYGRESAQRTGLLARVKASLAAAGVESTECGGVKSNPVVSFVRAAINLFRHQRLEAIVAVGGGSVVDTAKAVAAGVHYEGDVWDFFKGQAKVERAVPVLVVLSLAATASEMNDGAVITNEATRQKFGLGGEALFPKVSILDPLNTLSVPKTYTMYGAVDAIVHALEGYFSGQDPRTPFQDRLVESLVLTTMEAVKVLGRDLSHPEARAELMWCATLALNGLTTAGVGPAGYPMHMIEHSLSALYDIPHGAGLGVVAPAWMRYQSARIRPKLARFAERVFRCAEGTEDERAWAGIDAFEGWLRSLEVPTRLRDVRISESDIPRIAGNALMLARKWDLTEYSAGVISKILRFALD